jgi:hypothetical protein
MNQKLIMSTIHNEDPIMKAVGVILPIAYRVIDARAKTFTMISMMRISRAADKMVTQGLHYLGFLISE